MKKKNKIIVVAVIIVIAILITFWSLSPPKIKSLDEVMRNPNKYLRKNINIKATVENNSIKNNSDSIVFNITDGKNILTVIYKGSLPNNFGEGKKVILKGVLEKDEENNLYFRAEKITVGCPSRYN